MKFVIVFGPGAVGKMSVGKALAQLTGLKLFHNHMSIEMALHFFDYGEHGFRRINEGIRKLVLQEISRSDLKGVIFTFVWDLNDPSDEVYVNEFIAYYEKVGAEVYYLELEADQSERLIRNKHPDRLAEKASKRDLERSERALLQMDVEHRLNSLPGEFQGKKHLKINNTHLRPEEVARLAIEAFGL